MWKPYFVVVQASLELILSIWASIKQAPTSEEYAFESFKTNKYMDLKGPVCRI